MVRIAQHRVASPCGDSLSSSNLQDEVVRINHLGVELWVDLQGMPEADVARLWGGALAGAITSAMMRGGLNNVRRYGSPREFVTFFLRDLVDGAAWDRWYYDEFRPLRSLQTQEIAVQLLQARPDWIMPVFTELQSTGHGERLIERMTAQHFRRLWTAMGITRDAAPGFSQAEFDFVPRLAAIWPKVAMARGTDSESRIKNRFRLLLAAVEPMAGGVPVEPLAKAIRAMVDIAAVARLHPGLGPVLAMGSGLYPAAELQLSSGPLADVVSWLAAASEAAEGRTFTARVAEAVSTSTFSPAPPTALCPVAIGEAGHQETEAAAIPGRGRIIEDTHQRLEPTGQPVPFDQTNDEGVPEGSAARMNGVQSGGDPRLDTTEGLAEPTLTGFTGEFHPLTSAIGSVFLVCPALAELGLWELWENEVGQDAARLYVFVVALKSLGRTTALKVQDDVALKIFAGLPDTPRLNKCAVAQIDQAAGWPAEIPHIASQWQPAHQRDLVSRSVQGVHVLRDAAAGHWLGARPDDSGSVPSAGMWTGLPVDETAVRASPSDEEMQILAGEAEHFQLGEDLGYPWLTPSLDAELSMVASLALRRTAELLPGFGRSSPAYLARQFLAQPATILLDSDNLTIRLGGGPLGVILRLASLPQEMEIPWLPYPLSLTSPHGYGPLA